MKKSTKTIIGLIVVFIIVSIIGRAYENRIITINAKDIVNIETEGINGYGFITTEVNYNYADKIKDEYRREFLDHVNVYVSKEDNLSTGDKVMIGVDCPEYILTKSKVKFKNTKFEYTVPTLKEGEAIDIFEGLEVAISGVDGSGVAEITAKPDFDFNYYLNKTNDLRNGDTIRVDADFDPKELAMKGYGVKTNHKSFEVDSLNYYLTSFYDINNDNIDGCIKNGVQAVDNFLYKQNNPENTLMSEYPYIDFVETSAKVYFLDAYDENYELVYLIEGEYYYTYFWGLGEPTSAHIYAFARAKNPVIDKDGQINCDNYEVFDSFDMEFINYKFERLSASGNTLSIKEYLG